MPDRVERTSSPVSRLALTAGFLALVLSACTPATPTMQIGQAPPATRPTAQPSVTAFATASLMAPSSPQVPTTDPSLRLMFVTWVDDGVMFVPTRPPIGFAQADGSSLAPPSWSEQLARASGVFLAWSPDGRYVAFDGFPLDERGEVEDPYSAPRTLMLISEPATGALFSATPEGFWYHPLAGGPTWSPDGSRLALPLEVPPSRGNAIYLITPGANPRPLSPPMALFPSWSPAEDRVAYLEYVSLGPPCAPFYPDPTDGCQATTLKLIDVASSEVSTLLENTRPAVEAGHSMSYYNAPAWTPDGKQLVIFHGGEPPDLVAVDVIDGSLRILVPRVPGGSYIAAARGPQLVAFVSRATGDEEIFVVPSSGGLPENLTNLPSSEISPVWSPDGRFLAFLSDRHDPGTGRYAPFVLDTITREVRPAAHQMVLTAPTWVPPTLP